MSWTMEQCGGGLVWRWRRVMHDRKMLRISRANEVIWRAVTVENILFNRSSCWSACLSVPLHHFASFSLYLSLSFALAASHSLPLCANATEIDMVLQVIEHAKTCARVSNSKVDNKSSSLCAIFQHDSSSHIPPNQPSNERKWREITYANTRPHTHTGEEVAANATMETECFDGNRMSLS